MAMTSEDWLRECFDLIQRQGLAGNRFVEDARTINMTVRKDGVERTFEADFVKYLLRGMPALERFLTSGREPQP